MAGVALSSLGSGLDTEGIITGLVAVETQPLTNLKTKQSNINDASTTISSFGLKLSTFQTAARDLANSTSFSSISAFSTDSSVTASAAGTSTGGTFKVNVITVAREQRTMSGTQPSSTTALNKAGNLRITVGTGTPADVTVNAGDTLDDIANKISTSGARVTANVIYDGSTYRLMVRGLDSGAANTVSFAETGMSLGLSTPANTYQSALDTSLTVDNILITRPSATVSGAIPGVTLNVTTPTAAPFTVTLSPDSTALKAKIATLVAAYNDVVTTGHTAAGHGSTKATNPVLAGDRAIRSSLDTFASILANRVSGTSGSGYTSLASIGLNSTQDGLLSFTSSKFDAALNADPLAVKRLFVTDSSIGATGAMKSITDAVDKLTAAGTSVIASEISAYSGRTTSLTKQIASMQTRIDNYTTALRKQFTALDSQVNAYRSQAASMNSLTGAGAADSTGKNGIL